jgi:hypothetical protein
MSAENSLSDPAGCGHESLVERGVRYAQIFSLLRRRQLRALLGRQDLVGNHGLHCAETDNPLAGLIKDLKSRGMWADLLIVWHGEFGRRVTMECPLTY